jgi:hypothetical protein
VRFSAFILLVFISSLTVQPLFNQVETSIPSTMEKSCCLKHHTGSKKTCPLSQKDEKKKLPCGNNGCNPFMACSIGNFYLIERLSILSTPIVQFANTTFLLNDNRTAESLSECWHPPQIG